MQITLSAPPLFHTRTVSFTHMHSFILSLPLVVCVLWCFIWYPTIKPLFELPSIVYGFFLWGETESCLKGLQSRRLPSYWCRGVLPSSLLDQSLTSLLFYGWGHFTERSLTTSPQRFAKRYSSDSWRGWGVDVGGGADLDSRTVTHMCSHTSLLCTAVGATGITTCCGEVTQEALWPQDVVNGCCGLCHPLCGCKKQQTKNFPDVHPPPLLVCSLTFCVCFLAKPTKTMQ